MKAICAAGLLALPTPVLACYYPSNAALEKADREWALLLSKSEKVEGTFFLSDSSELANGDLLGRIVLTGKNRSIGVVIPHWVRLDGCSRARLPDNGEVGLFFIRREQGQPQLLNFVREKS